MSKILALLNWIKKVGITLPKIIASGVAFIQIAIKFVKELVTLIINILFPIIKSSKFKDIVYATRDFINKADEILEIAKEWLLKLGIDVS